MTKERLDALHELREKAWDLWMYLLNDHNGSDHSLNFIDRDDRRDYRITMVALADQITNLIHDELGIER